MGVMPVGKLLITMSLPMIISMLVQAAYNIIDSIFVAAINEDALTALSLAFPVQNLLIGVATGTGVGVNALLSKALGEKNYEKVNQIASNGVFLAFVGYFLFLIFGIFGSRFFFTIQTDNPQIIEYGTSYISICSICSLFVFIQIIFERLMQSTGRTLYSMFTQGAGAIVNIILDPILIFGLFGLPRLEVTGAALATVIGQLVSAIMGVVLNTKFNPDVKVKRKGFKPSIKIIGKIYAIGFPSIVMVGIGSVMNFGLNKILIAFSTTATAVLGVYYKIQSFAFMPLFGMNNGVIPIVAFNYGAGKRSRLLRCVKFSVILAESILFVAILVFQFLPVQLLTAFNASEHMISMGIHAFRIISLSYAFAGICIALGAVFQALGKSVLSMTVSICRQLVVLLPAAWLLSLSGNVNLVWWAFPIAEIASLTVSLISFIYLYKKIIKKIPDNK
ncbi:MAG: MATE family efflux transporter [Clostridia bacterium]|nr:MATE family efflux transporter [Clostridia bacterium]